MGELVIVLVLLLEVDHHLDYTLFYLTMQITTFIVNIS